MEIKSQKGISLITISIAVLILIIITSVLVYNAKDGVQIKNLENLNNDIMALNDKVSSYYIEYGDIPASVEYNNSSFISALESSGQKSPNDGNTYYVLDLKLLNNVTLNYGRDYDSSLVSQDVSSLKDLYIINKVSHCIYYANGVEIDGIQYYTVQQQLSDISLKVIPIYTAEQLAKVGSGETIEVEEVEYTFSLDGTYLLKNNIDLSSICYEVDGTTANDKSWKPIGSENLPFAGTFYGNGYEINNLYINSTADYQGLFGYNSGKVQDLGIASGSITTTGLYVGAIAGHQNYGQIENCYNNIDVTGSRAVAGIVGANTDGKIYYCYNIGNISSTIESNMSASAAGICAGNYERTEIKYCRNEGKITTKTNCAGGIAGSSYGLVESSSNIGNVVSTGASSSGTGGIVGYQNKVAGGTTATIKDCYNTGAIVGISRVGGICGDIGEVIIENCYNSSTNISASGTIGGIFAGGNPTIKNSYSIQCDIPLYTSIGTGSIDSLSSLKAEVELKAIDFIKTLNAGRAEAVWVKDTKSINKGYPILSWQ